MNFHIEGKGRALLMIHGFGVAFPIWQNLAPLLSPHFQLIEVELPGIGNSPMPDPHISYGLACAESLIALREKLGIAEWDVFCYSAGTTVAEKYLLADRQHIRRIVFLCPVLGSSSPLILLRLLIRLDRLWPAFGDWLLTDQRLAFLVRMLGFNGQAHPYVQLWFDEISSQPLEVIKATMREIGSFGTGALKQIPRPAKFIWGRQDVLAPCPRRLDATDVVIPGNHSVSMCASDEVARVALAFLTPEQLDPSSASGG